MHPVDLLRREWFLTRFAWHMQDYPQRAYRGIKADLRRELDVTAADVGMPTAVRGLGRPAVLAARYRDELGRSVPRWATGAVAAALVISLVIYLWLAYALGALDVLEATGGGTVTTHPFGGETVLTATDDTYSVSSSPSPTSTAVVLGLALTAFLLWSRAWRLLRR